MWQEIWAGIIASSPNEEAEDLYDIARPEACFAVGCSSLGTFSSRFTGLVGMPPSGYRRQAAGATAGLPSCVAKQVPTDQESRSAGPRAEPRMAAIRGPSPTGRRQGMNAHVSSILLGVRDMDRSKRFYTEGLGWKVQRDYRVSVFFEPHGGSLVGFYGRDGLAADNGVSPEGSGFSGLVLTHVVRSEARVDELMAEAEQAGATILKPAAAQQWGGYGGSFADPDGYIWNIGYSAQGKDQPYAE
jgi:uncharacterized protein